MDDMRMAEKAARENWAAYQRAISAGHREYVELAKKCDRFYRGGGEQWDEQERAALEADGRPALEINLILSTVNTMKGEHEAQRADIVFKPKRKGAQETADALTKLVMNIQDSNNYQYVEGLVFMDGIIQDRGYIDCRLDFEDHISGEVRLKSLDPLTVMPDASAKEYDPKTWKEVTIAEWMSVDDIKALYGTKVGEKVEGLAGYDGTFGTDSIRFEQNRFGDDVFANSHFYDSGDKTIRHVKVIERQHRQLALASFFVDNITGDIRQIPDNWDEERIARIVQAADVSIINEVTSRIRWTVSADGITLFDAWSPYKRFTVIPYFPYFRRGKPMGVVRNLLSPQEQLNKLESQELHIINTTANSGWTVEAGSLINMTEDELEERGAETGLVLVYRKGSQAPDKISANSIPTGIDRFAAKAANSIKTISGINEGLLGDNSLNVSGVTLKQTRLSGMTQLQVPFAHLNYTRQLLAEHMLEIIQAFYTETRVFQVTSWQDPARQMETITVNGLTPEGTIVNDLTLGEYAVTVSSAPARDSFEETQFAEALSLREAGVQIPDDVVISNSHLNDKLAIAERVRNLQGMGEPTEEQLRVQQFQQEMALREMELSVAELEQKVAKLSGEAAVLNAKAGLTEQEAQQASERFGAEMRATIEKMRLDWQKHITNLQNKTLLAEVHTDAKMKQLAYTTTAKRLMEETKARLSAFEKSLPKT